MLPRLPELTADDIDWAGADDATPAWRAAATDGAVLRSRRFTGTNPMPDDETHPELDDPIAERFAVFEARLASCTRPPDLIPGLLLGLGISMVHGQPRALKSWLLEEMARAIATADAAFGLERFRVPTAQPVWYLTEEDPELEIRDRFLCLLRGREQPTPDGLHVTVQKSLSLDDSLTQTRMIRYAQDEGIRATFIDPIRASSGAVDQGPRDMKPLAAFLRRYMRETGSIVGLGHHDTKPVAGKPDDRVKPQRASGGGIFSIADAPLHAERLDPLASRTLVTPSHFKFATAPGPFIVTLAADDPQRPSWVRLQGEDTTAHGAAELALHQKIVAFLQEHPGISGNKVAAGVHAEKARVLATLDRLLELDLVDFYQKGQAKYWTVRA